MAKQGKSSSRRPVPERTCVACRTARPKRDLVRVVHLTEGGIAVDETGKRNGRGAYLCRQRRCWDQAIRKGALNRALRYDLTAEETATLSRYAETLPEWLDSSQESAPESGNSSEEV